MTVQYQVFISHSSIDTWVAKQLARYVHQCGASTFLDQADIDHGDDFEERILAAADSANELLVLLTPWSRTRPYIWLEIGLFWGNRRRIVGVLYGLTAKDLSATDGIPALLKKIDLVNINDIDSYFQQLKRRVEHRDTDL